MDVSSVQVILLPDLDQSLRKYFYQVIKEAIDQVRIETSLDKEIFRLGEAYKRLSCSRSILKEFISQHGLKVNTVGDCQFIRKKELARFIGEYEM